MKIRTHLALLVTAVVVPLLAFAIIVLIALDRQQRTAVERGAVETARALTNGIDREIAGSVATLEALATTRSLAQGDLAAFYEDARRALASQDDWLTILLIDRFGQQVLNAVRPFGTPLPMIPERASFEAVLKTGKPAVGNLAFGPLTQQHDFPVRVPVHRDGTVAYVLTAVVKPSAMLDLLRSQRIPEEWVASVFDANRIIVARTKATDQFRGGPLSPEFMRVLESRSEGWAVTHTLEGVAVYTAFSRSAATGWGVGIGIPQGALDAPLRRSLWILAAGGAALLGAAVAVSVFVGRRIAGPIAALASSAQTFTDEGFASRVPTPGRVDEVDDVTRALIEGGAQLRARAKERDDALSKAEAAGRAKDEFLAVLSHELRTPLNAVYGWARLLRGNHRDPAAIERGLEVIERNAQAQVRLVEDLLDVSRIVTGKMRLDVRPIDLASVIEAALDSLRPAATAKGIRLQVLLDSGAPSVVGDPDRMQQVVWNLVANAIKFTPRDGRVQVQLQRVNSHVEISVSDTGIGIEPALLPYVFERFRQADGTSARNFGGLGLGLALVRHLVELHGGTMTAASAGPGHGATFVVKLPLTIAQPAVDRPPRVHPTAPIGVPGALDLSLSGIRVLAIDDAEDSLVLATTILRDAGATVAIAANASDALALVREVRPHVILCDLEMPGEDGFSFLRKLRALGADRGGTTPVAALTAYGRAEDRVRTLSAGFDMHLPKPVEPLELVAVVAVLAKRASADV